MRPLSFVRNGEVVSFRYEGSAIKRWIELGNNDGNTGPILLRIDYETGTNVFSSYGTIENPSKTRRTILMKNLSVFGGIQSPEEIVNPESFLPFNNMGLFIPDPKNKGRFIKI